MVEEMPTLEEDLAAAAKDEALVISGDNRRRVAVLDSAREGIRRQTREES